MSKASRQALKENPNVFVESGPKTLYLHKRERVKGDPKVFEQKVYQVDFLSTCIECKNGRPDLVGECKTKWCKMYENRHTKPKLIKEDGKDVEEKKTSEVVVVNPGPDIEVGKL